mgnify:CR=1 FL=1
MAISQRKLREVVFQILYSRDFSASSGVDFLHFLVKHLKVSKKSALIATDKADAVAGKFPEIDEKIEALLQSHSFDRISRVEKHILRLGLYELFHDESVPAEVAIAEAIRICRKFGSAEGAKFVNAILDGSYKDHQAKIS